MEHKHLDSLLEQIRNPNKRNWILMVPNSIGETLVVCGLCKSFKEKHGHGITLAIPPSHAFIVECFPDTFDRVVYMSHADMRQFSESGYIPPNFFQVDFPINTWPLQNGDGRSYNIYELWVESVGLAGFNFIDLYRHLLRLEWSAKFTLPVIPAASYAAADVLIEVHNLRKDKTVIFFIGNNSNKPSPRYLWEKTAELYLQQGFDIVINKLGAMFLPEGLNISNAKIIDIPLNLAVPMCEYAGTVVSGVNGFVSFALAAQVNCNMNVLLSNEVCDDYVNLHFKTINHMAGCHQLIAPELVAGAGQLREWVVPKNDDMTILDEIAQGIVLGENNTHAIVKL
jgi:hypothetical protein